MLLYKSLKTDGQLSSRSKIARNKTLNYTEKITPIFLYTEIITIIHHRERGNMSIS